MSIDTTHQALLYDSDEALLAVVTLFLLDGLEEGDRVLAVTSPGFGRLLRDGLGRAARDVEFIDARSWYDAPGRAIASSSPCQTGAPRMRARGCAAV